MAWDDESWAAPALERLDAPALTVATPSPLQLEAPPALTVATPSPTVRAVAGVELDDAWARRLERWAEVRSLLDRHPASAWPRTAPAWGLEGDVRAPIEAGGARAPLDVGAVDGAGKTWRRLEGGVRAAVSEVRPRRVVLRGGRRAGKSSNTCEIAVADATSGTWGIGAGDCGLYNIFSARKDQAADRIATCVQIAAAIGLKEGVDYRATTQHVVFPKFRTEIRVTVANEASAVSGTSIGGIADEVAHWGKDEGANPAAKILAQFKWSMATNRHAILWIVSAPILTTDPHAVEFDRCRADTLRVTIPSYVGNPTLDRDEMWAEAEDEIDALRNVEAVPCDVGGGAFYPQALVRRSFGE